MNRFQESVERKIAEFAAPIIEAHDAFLIDIAVRGSRQGRTIEIFIDNETGVTTDLCAAVSREVGKFLEEDRVFQGRYYLIVSSPGTDRPLVFPRQYRKHIGRTLSIKYRNEAGMSLMKGKLTSINDVSVTIQEENGTAREIPFNSIVEAKVLTIL
jgi:ribosome maturation factor RimP